MKRAHLGYLPREVARVLSEGGYTSTVQARLLKTYLGDGEYVEVLFQIVGPKERKLEYLNHYTPSEGHYTDYVSQVKYLKEEKRYAEAAELLLRLVVETEAEAQANGSGWGVAPWYYEQLAIIYRKVKQYRDEVTILQRYAFQPKAPGVGPEKLAKRLEKALALAEKHGQ